MLWWFVTPASAFAPGAVDWQRSGFWNIARVGDFNGDGTDDLVGIRDGACDIYMGSPTGLTRYLDVPVPCGVPGRIDDQIAVADVNQDGSHDLIANTISPSGQELVVDVVLYHGGHPVESHIDWRLRDHFAPSTPNAALALVTGDFDGDGAGDLVVLDPLPGEARLIWFPGSATGLGEAGAVGTLPAVDPDVRRVVADVNGDGYDDLVATWDPDSAADARLAVFLGSAAGLDLSTPALLSTPSSAPTFGDRLESVGDLDGDGDDDVLVSASDGASFEQWLYPGGPGGLGAPSQFGRPRACPLAAHAMPDIDGNGRGELIVSDPCHPGGTQATGVMKDGVLPASPANRVWSGAGAEDRSGSALNYGDFDSDGQWDWVMWDPTPALGVKYDAR